MIDKNLNLFFVTRSLALLSHIRIKTQEYSEANVPLLAYVKFKNDASLER